MKNLIKALLLMTLSVPAIASECKWEVVFDVNNWYRNYQQPEARMIEAVQVVSDRYILFDSYGIMLDTNGSGIRHVNPRQSLMSVVNSAGKRMVGKVREVNLENLQGWAVKKNIYEVLDVEEFYSKCRTPEERSRLLED